MIVFPDFGHNMTSSEISRRLDELDSLLQKHSNFRIVIVTKNPSVMKHFEHQGEGMLERVFLENLMPLLEIFTLEWVTKFGLAEMYHNYEFE